MQMYPYLSFKGDCEAAFKFYEQSLGGELGMIQVFDMPTSIRLFQASSDWSGPDA